MSNSGEEEKMFRHLTVEVAQDAFDSWNMLAARLDMLPDGARQYFERLCAVVHAFDPHEDGELVLSNHLENFAIRSKLELRMHNKLGGKSKRDYGQLFDWIVGWQRTEGVSLSKAFDDYIEIHELEASEYDAVKQAYYAVKNARLESMPQERDSI